MLELYSRLKNRLMDWDVSGVQAARLDYQSDSDITWMLANLIHQDILRGAITSQTKASAQFLDYAVEAQSLLLGTAALKDQYKLQLVRILRSSDTLVS